MNIEKRRELYEALAAPFPPECIQRTDGRVTGRGYSTTGIGYQYVVNRLNEVLGVGGFRVADRKVSVRETATSKGRPAFEAVCELRLQLGEWQAGEFVPFAEAIADGGHSAVAEADAIKGAFTNGFKKVAAFLGVGREAYEGSLDDDNLPVAPPSRSSRPSSDAHNDNRPTSEESSTSEHHEGRVTRAQLGKLRELAAELGFDWTAFRDATRKRHNVNIEYASRRLASQVISDLIAELRRARGNGKQQSDTRDWGHQ